MTKEDTQQLLKDICARLPYGVKVNIERDFPNNPQIVEKIAKDGEIIVNGILAYDIYYYKPYLRPMSSMTWKETNEWHKTTLGQRWITFDNVERCADWLNEHHFDYRGLIEKGLALEAPEGMYTSE